MVFILLTSCFSLLVVNFISLIKNKESVDKQTYVFGAEAINADDYEKYDVFEINSAEGFKTFQTSMMGNVESGNSVRAASNNVYNYAGKKIVQTNDIVIKPLAGITYEYEFAGEYDGQGSSIDYSSSTVTYDDNSYVGAFCTYLKGTVKNVHFKDITIRVNEKSGWFGDVSAGVVAGMIWSEGKVESCIVDWAAFESDIKADKCYVGMFAGENKGTIKNCMTINTFSLRALGKSKGLTAGAFVGKTSTGSITNCINTAEATDIYSIHTDNLIFPNGTQGAYASCSSAWSSMTTDASKAGGTGGSVWYKYATLSHGFGAYPYNNNGTTKYYYCVYPRVFITDWTTRYMKSEDENKGTVDKSELIIPNESGYATGSWDGNILTIYGNTIKAKAKDGYEFSYWGVSGNTWTAYFKVKPIELNFFDDDGDKYTYNDSTLSKLLCGVKGTGGSYTYTEGTEFRFEVDSGSTVKFDFLNSHSKCSYTISKDNCYAVVKINFSGKICDNKTFEPVDTSTKEYEMLFIITSSKHYITSCVNIPDLIANNDKDLTLTENLSVWIDIALKSYNVTFG